VRDAVVEGNVAAMLCNRKSVPAIGKMIKEMPTLKVIIYTDDMCKPEERTSKPAVICRNPKPSTLHETKSMRKPEEGTEPETRNPKPPTRSHRDPMSRSLTILSKP